MSVAIILLHIHAASSSYPVSVFGRRPSNFFLLPFNLGQSWPVVLWIPLFSRPLYPPARSLFQSDCLLSLKAVQQAL